VSGAGPKVNESCHSCARRNGFSAVLRVGEDMATVVRILDRGSWVYLNVDQIVRIYHHEAQGLWTVETAEGGASAQHYVDDQQAGQILSAMGWVEPA
jgi:hypothetical protein